MPLDATQLGFDGTVDEIRRLLVDRFKLTNDPAAIEPNEPLFSVGVGLSSLEGMDLLLELERQFGVEIKNVEWWLEEMPTVGTAATYLMELSQQRNATSG